MTTPGTPTTDCATAQCPEPGFLPRCQLCPTSPTYWRRHKQAATTGTHLQTRTASSATTREAAS